MSNLEANPLNGGMPAIENAPIKKKIVVNFMECAKPLISFRLRVLVL